jgi:hypothetical protein
MAADLLKGFQDNWPIFAALGGGSGLMYGLSTYVKHAPRTWPLTWKAIYFALLDGTQDLVSQKPSGTTQTVLLSENSTYGASSALQVTHTDPTPGTILPPEHPPTIQPPQ